MSLETQIKNAGLACEEFNKTYPVGTRVRYWKRLRSAEPEGESVTRTAARVVSGFAVVWLEGLPAGIKLKNIEPVIPDQQPFEWVQDLKREAGVDDGHELCWEIQPQGENDSLETLIRVRVVNQWKPGHEMRTTRYFFDEEMVAEYEKTIEQDSTRRIDSIFRYRVVGATLNRKP